MFDPKLAANLWKRSNRNRYTVPSTVGVSQTQYKNCVTVKLKIQYYATFAELGRVDNDPNHFFTTVHE